MIRYDIHFTLKNIYAESKALNLHCSHVHIHFYLKFTTNKMIWKINQKFIPIAVLYIHKDEVA